eukprot:SAG31_NODE_3440_length_4267_cov_15.646353_3_plen_56_part_00
MIANAGGTIGTKFSTERRQYSGGRNRSKFSTGTQVPAGETVLNLVQPAVSDTAVV